MANRVNVKPDLLRWAVDRAGLSVDSLTGVRVKPAARWLTGEAKPTLKQLQDFAAAVHVPFGYLFLDQPPDEKIPIPDYRTYDNNHPRRPSPDLIDTLHEVKRRQDWMRDYLVETGAEKLAFVGSITEKQSVDDAVERIRHNLGLAVDWMFHRSNQDDARRFLRNAVDDAGILISITGFVGMSTHRTLNPDEFCGFAICDDYVPALFVNNNISLSSQMFTIAHELAHIGMGSEGVFDKADFYSKDEEFCDKIAAEFLVPKMLFREQWKKDNNGHSAFQNLAKAFKVSSIVIARRAFDLDLISSEVYFRFWNQEKKNWEDNKNKKPTKKSGGSPYRNYRVKLGKSFSEAVISATRSGFLSYRDAFRLTGLKGKTFDKYMGMLQGCELD